MGGYSSRAFISLSVLVAVALAMGAAFSSLWPAPPAESRLQVDVERVALDPGDPKRERVGSLEYRGGLWLRSRDPRFGGLSDIRVSTDGGTLRAVSDCGRGFGATLTYDADGSLAGLHDPWLVDLAGPEGQPLRVGERDAESLAVNATHLEVGFEGKDRILAYESDPAFTGPGRTVPTPSALSRCGKNGGIEAMALLQHERRLLICERERTASAGVPAWIGSGPSWTERSYPLQFDRGWAAEPFRPTSAAELPDGTVLVLERRFPPLAARLVRLEPADVAGSGPLRPAEIARLEPPLTLDNFEGIDVRRMDTRTLVYLVSDDNNCAKAGLAGGGLQRTLLLMFALGD